MEKKTTGSIHTTLDSLLFPEGGFRNPPFFLKGSGIIAEESCTHAKERERMVCLG